ncbi:MAG TPA: hypothetical protein VGD63_01590, partial [Steroidobacteraceae bacterium]
MRALRPSPEQERWMATAARLQLGMDLRFIADRIGRWTAPSSIARCAFFVLGAVAALLTVAIFEFLHVVNALFASGLLMLLVAEWLILRKHLFHAGIEEALWTGGLLAVALQLIQATDINLDSRNALLIALALAVAGIRLLNPLFVSLAALAASLAINFIGGHQLLSAPGFPVPAGAFCFAMGAIALFAGRIEFRRPSHDQMLNWLMVFMPLCGFLWLAWDQAMVIRAFTGVASAVLAVAGLVIGLRRRTHAPLIACLVCLGCVAYQLRELTALPPEVKLILWGSAALLLAVGLERYLRTPRRGVTSVQIGEGGHA